MSAREKICLALDFSDCAPARNFASRFAGRVGWFKVGLELFVSEGPALVSEIARHGKVFLDLKLHDIPQTTAHAAAAAARTGASMLNVHCSGGREMMKAAAAAVREEAAKLSRPAPLVVGVTILTSLDDAGLAEIGFSHSSSETTAKLALLAKKSGLDGVVCSAHELPVIRRHCGPEFWAVVPGIRPESADPGDQKRVATPRAALDAGASILVIGRPVTQAADPEAALEAIVGNLEP